MTTANAKLEGSAQAKRDRYDGVMMSLHWLTALLVLANIGLGLYMGDLPRGDPMKFTIVQLHKSVGLTVLVLGVAVVLWRLGHRVPSLPDAMGRMLKLLARATQFVLYGLIVILPLSGWLMVSAEAHDRALSYFGLFNWPLVGFLAGMADPQRKATGEMLGETHETLAWIMIGLVVLHIAGALYHRIVARDGVVERMLPWG